LSFENAEGCGGMSAGADVLVEAIEREGQRGAIRRGKLRRLIIFFMFVFLFGCNTKSSKVPTTIQPSEFQNEYFLRFVTAFSSTNENEILSMLDYIDCIIVSGNTEILSIYYDKARFLYKIKRYDEAVETMKQPEEGFNKFYLASLFIRLGREKEGLDLLNEIIANNETTLEQISKNEQQSKLGYFYGLLEMYFLADKPIEPLITEFVDKNIITQERANELLEMYASTTKEIKLDFMWPE
jgi:tetratricopeptide (TPR) repeat protein